MPDLSHTPPPDDPTDARRRVDLTRTGPGRFRITNARGGTLDIGGEDAEFSPVELLLAALAGCAAVNVEEITARRAEPERFTVRAEGDKVRDEQGGRLVDLAVRFDVGFPADEAGDRAREVLPRTVQQTHDRICTVSRTVALGTPVDYRID